MSPLETGASRLRDRQRDIGRWRGGPGLGKTFASLLLFLPLIVSLAPVLLLQSSAYFNIHDNLDSDLVWFKLVAESEHTYSFSNSAVIPNVMNGLPRNVFPPALNLTTTLFVLFEPFSALLISVIFARVVAFFGMYLVLGDIGYSMSEYRPVRIGLATAFSVLPFWGLHPGLAISGLPLICWVFFRIWKNNHNNWDFLGVVLFAFTSSLIYTGIFLLGLLVSVFSIEGLRSKKWNWRFLGAITLMLTGYLVSELNLVLFFLGGGFISHRLEFATPVVGLGSALDAARTQFLFGHYHAPTSSFPLIVGTLLLLLVVSVRRSVLSKTQGLIVSCSLLWVAFAALVYGFWWTEPLALIRDSVPLVRVVNLSRWYWLSPFFWHLIFGISVLGVLRRWERPGQYLAGVLVLAQSIFTIGWSVEWRVNAQRSLGFLLGGAETRIEARYPGFREFYSQSLFQEVKDYIGSDPADHRVVSIGLYPEIAVFNGFFTLDSYQRNYPLEYKHMFRGIIASELKKDESLEAYFDDWGSRCYIFSHELGQRYYYSMFDQPRISVDLDFEVLRSMNCKFVISAVPIRERPGDLVLERVFSGKGSPYAIHVYRIPCKIDKMRYDAELEVDISDSCVFGRNTGKARESCMAFNFRELASGLVAL